jgi:hypothetical protein
MDIGEIISDSVRYPLSDWKKILILGIILVIGSIGSITGTFTQNWVLITFLSIIGFLVVLLDYGYLFRIIQSSIAGTSELPDFDAWLDMFIDGIKVAIVGFIYSLPAIIIILIFAASTILALLANPSVNSVIAGAIISAGIGILIAILYMLIITPIIAMAVANMAYNDSEIGAAFRFSEILDRIASIGWGDLIIWYIVAGIVYIILATIGGVITGLFSLISPVIAVVLMSLIVTPFLQMYLARSVALIYLSE